MTPAHIGLALAALALAVIGGMVWFAFQDDDA